MTASEKFVIKDLVIIIISVALAISLARTEVIPIFLSATRELELIGSFVAGIFFTSIFTTAPAIVTLGAIAQVNSVFWTALLGAMGAVIGDIVIFHFVRDRFAEHLMVLIKHETSGKRLKAIFKLKIFRWLTFLTGGLIIASPLPDELGISLLGFSKMKTVPFMILSFSFNFIGIILIGLLARSLI